MTAVSVVSVFCSFPLCDFVAILAYIQFEEFAFGIHDAFVKSDIEIFREVAALAILSVEIEFSRRLCQRKGFENCGGAHDMIGVVVNGPVGDDRFGRRFLKPLGNNAAGIDACGT